jgi:hypothetical protein
MSDRFHARYEIILEILTKINIFVRSLIIVWKLMMKTMRPFNFIYLIKLEFFSDKKTYLAAHSLTPTSFRFIIRTVREKPTVALYFTRKKAVYDDLLLSFVLIYVSV